MGLRDVGGERHAPMVDSSGSGPEVSARCASEECHGAWWEQKGEELGLRQWRGKLAGNIVLKIQDALNHDKGQKSAISGRRVHCIVLNFLQWNFSLFLQV